MVDNMLREFGLDPEKGHIINGHVPVHQSEGESPIKCDGKVIVIDGGFSKPYQKVTGIAGYTLIYNSYGLNLTAHEPFTSKADAVAKETDIVSNRVAVSYMSRRQLVGDTDTGHALKFYIMRVLCDITVFTAIRQNKNCYSEGKRYETGYSNLFKWIIEEDYDKSCLKMMNKRRIR